MASCSFSDSSSGVSKVYDELTEALVRSRTLRACSFVKYHSNYRLMSADSLANESSQSTTHSVLPYLSFCASYQRSLLGAVREAESVGSLFKRPVLVIDGLQLNDLDYDRLLIDEKDANISPPFITNHGQK